MAESNDRPLGITLLSVMLIISGLGMLVLQIVASEGLAIGAEALGSSTLALFFSTTFLGLHGLSAGVGMWSGKRWGWWLGALYMSYSVLRNINAIYTFSEMAERFGMPEGEMASHYSKYIGRGVWSLVFAGYFCRPAVVSYFDLPTKTVGKRVLHLIGVTLALALVMAGVTFILEVLSQ